MEAKGATWRVVHLSSALQARGLAQRSGGGGGGGGVVAGAPPPHLRDVGVVCMAVDDIRRERLCLGQSVILSRPIAASHNGAEAVEVTSLREDLERRLSLASPTDAAEAPHASAVCAVVWPLRSVKTGSIAVSQVSLAALGLARSPGDASPSGGCRAAGEARPASSLSPLGGEKPPTSSPRRKGGSSRRSVKASANGDDAPLTLTLRALTPGVDSDEASCVQLAMDDDHAHDASGFDGDDPGDSGDSGDEPRLDAIRYAGARRATAPLMDAFTLVDVRDFLDGVYVMDGHVFVLSVGGRRRTVRVASVAGSGPRWAAGIAARVLEHTVIRDVRSGDGVVNGTVGTVGEGAIPFGGIDALGGVAEEAGRLRDLLRAAGVTQPEDGPWSAAESEAYCVMDRAGLARPRGALLCGPSGVGKSVLAAAVARASRAHVQILSCASLISPLLGESQRVLARVFELAALHAPSVVVLDDVEVIGGSRAGGGGGGGEDAEASSALDAAARAQLSASLAAQLEELPPRCFVIATTPEADGVDVALRRSGRLDSELELAVPSALARLEILRALLRQPRPASGRAPAQLSEQDLALVADSAHGFVAADLEAMCDDAARLCLADGRAAVDVSDIRAARARSSPSALREIAVEVPRVRWGDVGGNDDIKTRLQEAISAPLRRRASAKAAAAETQPQGIAAEEEEGGAAARWPDLSEICAPRGLLLFGPPGCSKTLLAKAVATEAGANFLSVKGPELLSKYVGDSEKAVRALFRRARAVAPSIVFFDELDALATVRGAGGGGGGGGSGAEARVLAQLLVEMDWENNAEDNDAVVVIAATNRPDLIDAALLRPGRMDLLLYVGLPGLQARREILRVHMRPQPWRGVDVDALARRTDGYSGAEISALVREAALAAMDEDVENASEVLQRHYDVALRAVKPRTSRDMLDFYARYIKSTRGVIIGR